MAHSLPPAAHPAREMFDISDLVAIGTGERAPLTLSEAKCIARRTLRECRAASRACFFVVRGNDALELVSIGRRGGHKTEWRFA